MSKPVSTIATADALFIERADRSEVLRVPRLAIRLPAFLFSVSVWVLACVTGFETLKSLRLSVRRTWF